MRRKKVKTNNPFFRDWVNRFYYYDGVRDEYREYIWGSSVKGMEELYAKWESGYIPPRPDRKMRLTKEMYAPWDTPFQRFKPLTTVSASWKIQEGEVVKKEKKPTITTAEEKMAKIQDICYGMTGDKTKYVYNDRIYFFEILTREKGIGGRVYMLMDMNPAVFVGGFYISKIGRIVDWGNQAYPREFSRAPNFRGKVPLTQRRKRFVDTKKKERAATKLKLIKEPWMYEKAAIARAGKGKRKKGRLNKSLREKYKGWTI